jgi:uncharacterized protein (TIGR02757 family)
VIGLRELLERQYDGFNRGDSATDPVQLVRRYSDPRDLEIAGFCAAGLAFGRVASVIQSIERLFAILGDHPAAFVRAFDPAEHQGIGDLGHRWVRGRDLIALIWILRQILERSRSLEAFFLEGYSETHVDIQPALESFCERALALDVSRAYGHRRPKEGARHGVCHFFPRPSAGSACKRLNLFLRWLVRRDEIDLGVWTRVAPSKLIVPLDTHVIRLGRCLRLTTYLSPGWKMAAQITAALRELDPSDPVRYDFSLCHLGMAGMCGYGTPRGNLDCPLKGICRPIRRPAGGAAQARPTRGRARTPEASRGPSDRR